MFDRNDLDLRLAQHHERVARLNATGWRQHAEQRRPLRAGVARLLLVLANRLAPWMAVSTTPAGTSLQVSTEQS